MRLAPDGGCRQQDTHSGAPPKKTRPDPGQTGEEAGNPDCRNTWMFSSMSDEDKSECQQCGIIDRLPLLDKLRLVIFSIMVVSGIRALAQLIVTRCTKKDPWHALVFPCWEGPLLITHWFSCSFHFIHYVRCTLGRTVARPRHRTVACPKLSRAQTLRRAP